MSTAEMRSAYDSLRAEGTRLAGGLTELAQRATVYHHVYQDSGGNHAFPLIAAHGALWAKGYFSRGLSVGSLLSLQYLLTPEYRRHQLSALHEFADTFRDINRRVCVDIYANYHFAKIYGDDPVAEAIIPRELLDPLRRIHAARREGRALSDIEREAAFKAHFLHEQENIVGPTLAEAIPRLRWPIAKFMALRPTVRFAYFPRGRALPFHDFSLREERVRNGFQAFQIAVNVGWEKVASALRRYELLPDPFFRDAKRHFEKMRETVLGLATATTNNIASAAVLMPAPR